MSRIVKLRRVSRSHFITVPRDLMRVLCWDRVTDAEVELTVNNGVLTAELFSSKPVTYKKCATCGARGTVLLQNSCANSKRCIARIEGRVRDGRAKR